MPDNSFEDFVADMIMRDNGFEQYARWFKPLRLHHKEIFRILPETGFLTAQLMWYICDNRYYKKRESMSINSLKKSLEKVHSISMERMEIDFNHHVPELANSVNLNKIHNKLNYDIIPSRTHPNYRSNHLEYYSPKLIDLVKKLDRFFSISLGILKDFGYCLIQIYLISIIFLLHYDKIRCDSTKALIGNKTKDSFHFL